MSNNFNYVFSIDGLGPHYDKNKIHGNNFSSSSMNIAIYAENGKGKTFISRAFALNEKERLSIADSENLLSLGKTNGNFSFNIKHNDVQWHNYSVELKKGEIPNVNNEPNDKIIYHVFNSDFVENNIISKNFSPDSNIDGYIVGELNIDVSNDKDKLESQRTNQQEEKSKIEKCITSAKTELKNKNISINLLQFKSINFDNIIRNETKAQSDSLETLFEQYTKIKSIPEDIPELIVIKPQLDVNILNKAKNALSKEYSIAYFDEEAMKIIDKVKSQREFYEQGLKIYKDQNNGKCPFCQKEIDENLYYLNLYRDYFSQAESKALTEIDNISKEIESLIENIKNYFLAHNKLIMNFDKNKLYIPEYSKKTISELSNQNLLIEICKKIKQTLQEKRNDLKNTDFDISLDIENYINLLKESNLTFDNDLKLVSNLQKNLKDSNSSRLNLVRKICDAKFNFIIEQCQTNITNFINIKTEIEKLIEEIQQKEGKAKIAKKDVVTKDFKRLLDYFFGKKYSLNENTFSITFLNESLNERAKHVLSDGEKSIVAFCYYLATTHILIKKESDYNNLIFVLDDPISSLDFNYVYVVADVIRGIKNYFPKITTHTKFIVLTHNAEFMSILCRNNIAKLKLYLKKGKLQKLNQELLLPYGYHLKDIFDVANEFNPPSHTTPNSIRQIIETIINFEKCETNSIEEYMRNNDILNKNAFIYSLMQDKSHGNINRQPSISDDDVVIACKILIKFVESKYPDQIKYLNKN